MLKTQYLDCGSNIKNKVKKFDEYKKKINIILLNFFIFKWSNLFKFYNLIVSFQKIFYQYGWYVSPW